MLKHRGCYNSWEGDGVVGGEEIQLLLNLNL
jgi:hypothetical protein